MAIHKNFTELIGNTPLLRLSNVESMYGLSSAIVAKLEFMNPAGSIKDRVAKSMIDDAEKSGKLKKGGVIIEPTSGNTGIGIAAIATARGYRVILTMPDTMSIERRKLLTAYNAELILTEGARGMAGAIEKAEELAKNTPNSFIPRQFINPANPAIHKMTTGPEIWEQTGGCINILIAGVGTGGTLTGVGEYLKSKKADIEIIAVEPSSSPVLSSGKSGRHNIQGIGAGFVPNVLNTSIYNEVITVNDNDAFEMGKIMARIEGLLAGISSGAAAWAAVQIAKRPENQGKTIVVIFPDSGERYLSTQMFGD